MTCETLIDVVRHTLDQPRRWPRGSACDAIDMQNRIATITEAVDLYEEQYDRDMEEKYQELTGGWQ